MHFAAVLRDAGTCTLYNETAFNSTSHAGSLDYSGSHHAGHESRIQDCGSEGCIERIRRLTEIQASIRGKTCTSLIQSSRERGVGCVLSVTTDGTDAWDLKPAIQTLGRPTPTLSHPEVEIEPPGMSEGYQGSL